jgi:aminoglycoside N3'-acetyltransferase
MATFTREDLHAAHIAEKLQKQEKDITRFVNAISECVIIYNKEGKKKYKKIMYNEPDTVIFQVIKQLQSIFIDSTIVYTETDNGITIDWSLPNIET